jgi:hypothetical protein
VTYPLRFTFGPAGAAGAAGAAAFAVSALAVSAPAGLVESTCARSGADCMHSALTPPATTNFRTSPTLGTVSSPAAPTNPLPTPKA